MSQPDYLLAKATEVFHFQKHSDCIRCILQSGYGVAKSPAVGQCKDIGRLVYCFVHDISDYLEVSS